MKQIQMRLKPEQAYEPGALLLAVQKKTGNNSLSSDQFKIVKRSIDARKPQVIVQLQVMLLEGDEEDIAEWHVDTLPYVGGRSEVIIVGSGPAGLFAAIRAIEKGLKPIVLERGKDVQSRRRDLAAINKEHIVNPHSNYCFGEGGAGTYSDGKLYTRSKKRGDVRLALEKLVAFGASGDILVDAHPHIGTNKLPKIIASIREKIIECGGEVRFDAFVSDFIITGNRLKGVVVGDGERLEAQAVVLATGHSARDIYHLLDKHNVVHESKSFALGVRIEHSQELIDRIQYHCQDRGRGPYLPAASYSLVEQVRYKGSDVGVFSFCMCPGGFIVPAATSSGEVVVNGMSPSRRDSRYSNSGVVVAVDESDYIAFKKEKGLAALRYQQEIEQRACELAGGTQAAPAQRVVDFTKNKVSDSLLDTSYQPGVVSVDMKEVLPSKVSYVLDKGLQRFGKKMRGYYTNEAQILGVESRTSSPVKIPRDGITCEHSVLKGLYPCGEGAGYAGGIISAILDGERVMDAVMYNIKL